MDELSIALLAMGEYPRKVFREVLLFTPARVAVFILLALYALRVIRDGDD
jgi:hypothetical protein